MDDAEFLDPGGPGGSSSGCSPWYWQLDRGGPDRRAPRDEDPPDFLFVQMAEPAMTPGWTPSFLDYLYMSFTSATAFSPTDSSARRPCSIGE